MFFTKLMVNTLIGIIDLMKCIFPHRKQSLLKATAQQNWLDDWNNLTESIILVGDSFDMESMPNVLFMLFPHA